jgi:hypothetical protein
MRSAQLDDDAFPPFRPAACFGARLPPLPEPVLDRLRLLPPPLPDCLPPLFEEPGLLEIAAARLLLIPFLRSPSRHRRRQPWSHVSGVGERRSTHRSRARRGWRRTGVARAPGKCERGRGCGRIG